MRAGKRVDDAQVVESLQITHVVTLGVVDTDGIEFRDHCLAIDIFRNATDAQQFRHGVDRFDHGEIDLVTAKIPNQVAVDLDEIDTQVLEGCKTRQAAAEVVERETAADFLQTLDQPARL